MESQSWTQLSDWTELNLIHEGSSLRTPHLLIPSHLGVKILTNEFWRNTEVQTTAFCLLPAPFMCIHITSVMPDSLRPYGLPGSSGVLQARVLDSPGKCTGVGCHALLQGIFLTLGSNPCLMSPALTGEFFTTSTSWEMHLACPHLQPNLFPCWIQIHSFHPSSSKSLNLFQHQLKSLKSKV